MCYKTGDDIMGLIESAISEYGLRAVEVDDFILLHNSDKTKWIDDNGYKYYLSRANIISAYRKGHNPAKFFRGNIYTEDNVRLYVDAISNGDIKVVSFNATNAHDKIEFYSSKYNYNYSKSFNAFTHSPYIVTKHADYVSKLRPSIDLIKADAFKRFDITIISDAYINNESPLLYVCNKDNHCGVTQSMPWRQMISNECPCQLCRTTLRKIYSIRSGRKSFERKLELSTMVNPYIDVVGKYQTAHKKIECVCTHCGCTIFLRPDHILNGVGCGKCTKSLGEKLIEAYLIENDINYITQYSFPECKMTNKSMPFDFFLPNHNVAIEYDGEQHFYPIDVFGGKDGFLKTVARDSYKTDYCNNNGVTLLRIPYTDLGNIQSLLNNFWEGRREASLARKD